MYLVITFNTLLFAGDMRFLAYLQFCFECGDKLVINLGSKNLASWIILVCSKEVEIYLLQSCAKYLHSTPDIACYSKLLTGGSIPLAVTLASASVFEAFKGSSKVWMWCSQCICDKWDILVAILRWGTLKCRGS